MSIQGTIILEDTVIQFVLTEDREALYTVRDTPSGAEETKRVPQADFLAALAIAVHNDGTPNWKADYDRAESVQPDNRYLRGIP